LALSYAAGYAIPTTIKQSNWDDAYTFVAGFPTQTGNSGKYLTTNGSTLSWDAININNLTGTLSVAKGGTGATTLTGVLIGNGTSAFTAVTGGPNQILRVNGTATGYEFYSASFLTNPMTLNFDMIYQSGGVPARLAGPTSTTKQFLTAIGNSTTTTSLGWGTIATSDIPSAALTRTNDTNVQITLGGTPNSSLLQAVSLTMGWTGQLAVGRGGTGASTLTGVVIGNNSSAMTAVAGTAGQFLRRNTTNTAYEFRTLQGSDIAGSELTFANDTNVTMTLGGTPASSLLQPVSINLGWTGQLAVGRGGTGASTLTGVLVGNGTSAISAITGTANQILRRNATNTAYEFWTANYMTNPMTLEGSIIYATTGGTPAELFANSTGTRKYLSQINGTAPTWETVAGGGGVSGSGTVGRIAKFFGGTTVIADSIINESVSALDIAVSIANTHKICNFRNTNASGFVSVGIDRSSAIRYALLEYSTAGTTEWYVGTAYNAGATNDAYQIGLGINLSDAKLCIKSTGQLKLNNYVSTTSFSGTPAGYLAFTSSGDIITVAAPSGGGSSVYRIDFNSAMPDTWTNMPSALAFFDGSTAFITAAELTNFTQVRLLINKLGTAGAASSIVVLRYNTTYTQNVNLWSTIGTTSVQLAVNNTNQLLETAWIDLVAGAKADVFIALMGSGGDGAIDPIFGMIAAEFR
jgi:hypothetical protein